MAGAGRAGGVPLRAPLRLVLRLPLRAAARTRGLRRYLDGFGDRPGRPLDADVGRGAARHARPRRRAPPGDLGCAGRRLVPGAARRRLLQPRRGLRDARARGVDGRHVGGDSSCLRDGAAAASPGALSALGRRDARRRGRLAVGRRESPLLAGPDLEGCERLACRPRPRLTRADVPVAPRRRAQPRLAPARERRGPRADVRHHAARPAPGRSRGCCLPLRGGRRLDARARGDRRHGRCAAQRSRLGADHGRRARAAGHDIRCQGGVAARCGRRRARAAGRDAGSRTAGCGGRASPRQGRRVPRRPRAAAAGSTRW